MNKNTAKVVAWTAVVTASIFVIAQTKLRYNKMLYERFPEFDHKVIRKAYKKLMLEAVSGKVDVESWSDDEFDQHFRREVYLMQFAK